MATNSGIDFHDFITQEQWDASNKFDGTERILKWVEVPLHTIFCVNIIEEKKDTKFQSYVLHFCDRNEVEYQCFAPSHFIKEIRKRRESNARPYFTSFGTIEHKNKQIAKFEISYKIEQKHWNIFQ